MLSSSLALREPGEHPGQFGNALFALNPLDGSARALTPYGFGHTVVCIGEGRHLRKVSDHQNLSGSPPTQFAQRTSHRPRGLPSDARIDFIENHRRCGRVRDE